MTFLYYLIPRGVGEWLNNLNELDVHDLKYVMYTIVGHCQSVMSATCKNVSAMETF